MTQNSILQQAANRRTGGWQACLRAFLPLIVSLGLILGTPSTMAQEGVASESQMKAAFLVNFPKYVDWPAAAFSQANSPVVVAIFGDEEVVREFYQMIEGGRTINGHPVVLKRITAEEEIGSDCQILFVGASQRQRIPAILEKLKSASVLTVSESDNFLEKGGVVNLIRKDQNIRLGVNLAAARQAHLRISSSLLSVADVVKGKSN